MKLKFLFGLVIMLFLAVFLFNCEGEAENNNDSTDKVDSTKDQGEEDTEDAENTGKTVKVGTLTDYPPYCFDKENAVKKPVEVIPPGSDSKQLQGYSWDIIRESYHQEGYTIELYVTPWSRCLTNVESGVVDVMGPAGKNDERLKIYNYSKEAINRADFVVYVNKDSNIEWNGLESLEGLNIAQRRGFNYGEKWNNNTTINKIDIDEDILNGFKSLKKGAFDGFVGYEIPWDYELKKSSIKDDFRKLSSFDFSEEFLVSHKNFPESKKYLEIFDKGKNKIIESGKFEEIENSWK
jgi:polar amino acid transport system substrate-binding protein